MCGIDRLPKFERGYVEVSTIPLPRDAISQIVVNHEARAYLDASNHALLDPDYLSSLARISVEPRPGSHERIHSLLGEGRSLPVARFKAPVKYSGLNANYITAKGGGMAGDTYRDFLLSSEPKLYRGPEADPLGLFGDFDAASDIFHTNKILEMGGRATLGLGYVTLNKEAILGVVESMWNDANANRAVIKQQYELVSQYGDEPAILFRLIGSRHRLTSGSTRGDDLSANSANRNELALGLSNLENEVYSNPRITKYIEQAGLEPKKAQEILGKLSRMQALDLQETLDIHRLVWEISIAQGIVLFKTMEDSRFAYPVRNYGSWLGCKDISKDLVLHDLEWGPDHKEPDSSSDIDTGIFDSQDDVSFLTKSMVEEFISNLQRLGLLSISQESFDRLQEDQDYYAAKLSRELVT